VLFCCSPVSLEAVAERNKYYQKLYTTYQEKRNNSAEIDTAAVIRRAKKKVLAGCTSYIIHRSLSEDGRVCDI
jgi:hypothetical protein